MKPVRIATRGSDLALWQARYVARRIETELYRGTELVPLTTTGDRLRDVSLAKVGGKGLFVKEIEEALLDGRADLAVHSAKDLPANAPAELGFAAFPERADPRDAFVGRRVRRLEELPRGARVGTGSVRRTAQLRRHRPDLVVVALRGNVQTRLAKLEREDLDAVILACAGLDRLELGALIGERVDPATLLPAVAQGALALQVRRDGALAAELAALEHAPTATCVAAERSFQARLGGDCSVPLAAYAELRTDGGLWLRARLLAADGSVVIERTAEGPAERATELGDDVGGAVLAAGGSELLAALRAEGAG